MILLRKSADGSSTKIRLKSVSGPAVTIGRGKEATLTFEDGRCSRIHCAIMFWDDIFVIRDMNSSNGTYLNGQKIEVARLKSGDVIKIGDTVITSEAEASNVEKTIRG